MQHGQPATMFGDMIETIFKERIGDAPFLAGVGFSDIKRILAEQEFTETP
jgi:hypothetical protein